MALEMVAKWLAMVALFVNSLWWLAVIIAELNRTDKNGYTIASAVLLTVSVAALVFQIILGV